MRRAPDARPADCNNKMAVRRAPHLAAETQYSGRISRSSPSMRTRTRGDRSKTSRGQTARRRNPIGRTSGAASCLRRLGYSGCGARSLARRAVFCEPQVLGFLHSSSLSSSLSAYFSAAQPLYSAVIMIFQCPFSSADREEFARAAPAAAAAMATRAPLAAAAAASDSDSESKLDDSDEQETFH